MTKIIAELDGTAVLIVITDHEGYIIELYGDEMIKCQSESLGLSTGIRLKEEEAGTNSIEMALKLGESVQLIDQTISSIVYIKVLVSLYHSIR